jgi:hypothetical protein
MHDRIFEQLVMTLCKGKGWEFNAVRWPRLNPENSGRTVLGTLCGRTLLNPTGEQLEAEQISTLLNRNCAYTPSLSTRHNPQNAV